MSITADCRDAVLTVIRGAGLDVDDIDVKNIQEYADETGPTNNQCPIIWVEAKPSGLNERLTADSFKCEIDLSVWCWISTREPGKEGREKSLKLLQDVQRAMANTASLCAAQGVMPGGYQWSAYEFYEGSDICGCVCDLTLTAICAVGGI